MAGWNHRVGVWWQQAEYKCDPGCMPPSSMGMWCMERGEERKRQKGSLSLPLKTGAGLLMVLHLSLDGLCASVESSGSPLLYLDLHGSWERRWFPGSVQRCYSLVGKKLKPQVTQTWVQILWKPREYVTFCYWWSEDNNNTSCAGWWIKWDDAWRCTAWTWHAVVGNEGVAPRCVVRSAGAWFPLWDPPPTGDTLYLGVVAPRTIFWME